MDYRAEDRPALTAEAILPALRWAVRDWLGSEPSGCDCVSDTELDRLLANIFKITRNDPRELVPEAI